jgi:hypothetical protein
VEETEDEVQRFLQIRIVVVQDQTLMVETQQIIVEVEAEEVGQASEEEEVLVMFCLNSMDICLIVRA